uniref:Uncharacterized protein n=1 Tax=Meloidogyne hapla TaxID=6305 RepID=A0A1I8BRR3_MELHA
MGFQQLSHFGNLETTEIEKLNEKNLLNKFLIIKSPEETFKIILNKWFIEQKKDGIENLELIMSSPYLKVEGGNIQAIVVYSGEKNERTKSLFRGDVKNTICKDEDHTLFCHLCRNTSRNWINQMMIKTSKNLTKGNDEERQENVYKLYNLSLFKTYEYLENLFKESKENHMVVSNAFITLKSWAKGYNIM